VYLARERFGGAGAAVGGNLGAEYQRIGSSPAGEPGDFVECSLDDRWEGLFRAFERLDPATIIRGGWETAHPRPIFLGCGEARAGASGLGLCEMMCAEQERAGGL